MGASMGRTRVDASAHGYELVAGLSDGESIMNKNLDALSHELQNSDERSREARANRLQFLVREYGKERWTVFTGGEVALRMFEEAREAYVNGLYLSTVLLCHGAITQQLVGVFREQSKDDVADSDAATLYSTARDARIISPTDFSIYNRIRKIRNAYVHPPLLGSRSHLAYRALHARTNTREITARDARMSLRALFLMLKRPRFSAPA